ncbi:MAG: four-helix bundle copper-binding protein [Cupriavidus sp.]|uniref:Four-helix bundle copper-binding protein n=1 Tax=Cupriavidus metallidurans TaxID=119219 RepID=A0A482J2Y9_9BURK|nr:four-helix bundle copper-binding protein [Cupriavidus pauculus]MCA3183035.1 four-helix bundle copper-binding protein [Cupriavidus sp.]QBP13400.1 four-helix bundle copper-binding protein [Cupriavidus metallidurans]QWE96452.1 four-helix bundle copper-binding protein [Cupriavidus sp. EM10]MCA3194280.1 four-helix bundle copper-binding protein [Cupriavidus sp.]
MRAGLRIRSGDGGLRKPQHAREICALCATICERCEKECSKHGASH